MKTPVIVTGDDILFPATLKKDNNTFTIDPTATITSRVVSVDHYHAYSDEVVQSNSTVGSDWANSLVVISFPSSITSAITHQGECEIEIQVDYDGKTTWFARALIVKGNVD